MGKCLRCGSSEHLIRDCLSWNEWKPARPLAIAPTPPGKSGSSAKSKVPARVYAINKEDIDKEVDVVEGMFPVSGKLAKVLFDLGSTHSFVRPKFMQELSLKREELPHWVEVSVPTGDKRLITDKIWKACDVLVCNRKCPANLISLSINGYDVILGMDWLSTYQVLMDCETKNIKLCIPGELVLECNCRKSKESLEMVSGEKIGKILRK